MKNDECPILRKIWRGKELEACLLCGGLGSSTLPLVKCPRPDCIGIYCVPCYGQLQNICTLCKLPIEYGDLSDMSEERDSSDVVSLPGTEDTSSTADSNTTGAVLEDTAESELSFGYQFRNRDIEKDKSLTTSAFIDLEAQKPISRATINDFAYPIEHHPEEDEHKLTLSQRRKSGLWSLIVDADDEKKKPKFIDLSPVNIVPPVEDTQEHHVDKEEEIEQSHDLLASPPPPPPAPPKSKVQRTIKKFLHFPRLKRHKKKAEKTDQSENESDKPFLSTPSKTSEGSKKPKKKVEGTRIHFLKQKLFGDVTRVFKQTSDSTKSENEEISIQTVTSKESKSTKMVENWIKTGNYHGSEVFKEAAILRSETPSLPLIETKQSTGYKNLFKRLFGKKEDAVSATTEKHSVDTKSQKKEVPQTKGSIWKFWKKKEIVSCQLIPQRLDEAEVSKLLSVETDVSQPVQQIEKTDGSRPFQEIESAHVSRLVHQIEETDVSQPVKQISLISFEDEHEPFMSMKRVQTPAKIVHERFKIDEE
ncbi:unnamed protein product [Nezara viridula]|uniref:E3 ubiquitin-protein ligase DCST1-like C-terminal domain-containing protein n=1 Tax=Nezara viridula TaxID=85310 RepID=A0A9P0HM34_NEZVI|nr:unnamed protein product [Nezara viridula]